MPKYIPQKVDGVVLLDKPGGISSQSAVTVVKASLSAAKAGHTGTLDPMATGLLPVCLGEATKYSHDLLNADKSYLATILFGVSTDTGDAEGKVIRRGDMDFNVEDETLVKAKLEGLLAQFLGEINQIPPMYSALKRDGKPLYEYARAGQVLDIAPRRVKIHELRWVSVSWPVATLEVTCSKGTYIRSLASDMGDALGCGAHLTALRRTRVGHLDIRNSVTLDQVKNHQADIHPVDTLVKTLPVLVLNHELSARLRLGQRVPISDVNCLPGLLAIYCDQQVAQSFIGTAELRDGVLHPARLISQQEVETLLTPSLGMDQTQGSNPTIY